MSVNGASSGKNRKINFCDLDGMKKNEIERRRKLRLGQVRIQCKEMSSQIRERVEREKHRQLRNIEEIKRKESLSWKEQHVTNTMADYHYCLSNLGDAHVAAERENRLTEHANVQQLENRKIAAIRGRKALQKERLKDVKKNERFVKRKAVAKFVEKNVENALPQVCDKEDVNIITDDDDCEQNQPNDEFVIKDLKHLFGNKTTSSEKCTNDQELKTTNENQDKQKDGVPLSKASDLIEVRRRARNQMLEFFQGTSSKESFSQSTEPCPKLPQEKPLHAAKSPKHSTKSPIRKSPGRDLMPKSLPSTRTDNVALTNRTTQRSMATTIKKVNTPNKVVKSKNAVTQSKFSSPQRREFVPRFTKNTTSKPGILKNTVVPVISETSTAASPEKVQFYDHFSKYSKEYDSHPGMVVRESRPPTINANEAARVQKKMDEIRFQQLEQLRQKSEQRSKESLQKNQIRKDYENLSKELDELCKEENRLRELAMKNDQFSEERIDEMARNRQQNMNRAFEDVYIKPVVITCPPVGSTSSSSDINVATSSQSDKQRIDPLDSSDSCTSILLGYVDNRSRKLAKDITQCKDASDGEKRKKLAKLLTRLDQLRKMLMEEIVRNSSLNLEPFYRSVLEVETEKKEILCDSDANKENGDMKKGRERKPQDLRLERKIAELFVMEQRKPTESANDSTFESVNSETMNLAVDRSDSVKILIEVKNVGKVQKSRNSKNVDVVSRENVPKVRNQSSMASSASTAYRSPPRTFQTDFTKVLSNQATAKTTTKIKPIQQKPLSDYINRLLGMSQHSIDQLGVSSSSSIATPTNSVIEVPENMSVAVIDRNHLNRIQEKIDENIRFAREVDDSFKQLKNQPETENVTNKVNNSNKQETKFVKTSQSKRQEKIPETMNSNLPEQSKKVTQKIRRKGDPPETNASPMIPENSKQIIDDLTKRIEQVRQDKQKMLEKNVSSEYSSHSSSGKDFDATEYRDFANLSKSKSKDPVDENVSISQASDIVRGHFIEESKNLVNTKQIGISFSRDSGIGSSRPVTSTDFRVSPDIKVTETSAIPQVLEDGSANLPVGDVSSPDINGKSIDGGVIRKSTKPPISLKRYSPHLNTEPLQPHDLSTINEVETSAASRFNQTIHNETSDSLGLVPFAKFPTFGEYVKLNEVGSTEPSDAEKSSSETILKKMLEVTCVSETGLNYRKLDRSPPKNKTSEKSTNTQLENEYIDVEKEIRRRRLTESDISLSTSTDSKKLSSTSSDVLAKDFKQIGMNWASAMLKKTSTAQNLESSSSSIKSPPILAAISESVDFSSDDRINGNPLNIRDFLARELLKRSQLSTSSSISDNSTLTDQFLKSLLTTSSNSSIPQQATTIRTSTPNRNLSTESEKFAAAHDVGHTAKDDQLFSGESVLSSVRGMSQSEMSGPITSD